jgi:hypothetical protein
MSRRPLLWRLMGMSLLLGTFLLVSWPLPCGAQQTINNVPSGLFLACSSLAEPASAADNATPVGCIGQLLLNQAQPPGLDIAPVLLDPAGFFITPVESFLPFTPICSITTGNTTLVCQLLPTGATWGASGFLVFNVQLTATDGRSVTTNPITFRIQ